jgi:hypothetical protein
MKDINKDWIFKAASNIAELEKGGAFIKVLLRKLDLLVNHILSKIVTFADKNYNLSLIDQNNEHSSSELQSFWMKAFSHFLHFDTLKDDQAEVYNFCCQFPFSYYLQHAIQSVLKIQQGLESNTITGHLKSKMQLLNTIPEIDFTEMTTRYINDLIQLRWPFTYNDEQTNAKELQVFEWMNTNSHINIYTF